MVGNVLLMSSFMMNELELRIIVVIYQLQRKNGKSLLKRNLMGGKIISQRLCECNTKDTVNVGIDDNNNKFHDSTAFGKPKMSLINHFGLNAIIGAEL